jgi:hypothetical protein
MSDDNDDFLSGGDDAPKSARARKPRAKAERGERRRRAGVDGVYQKNLNTSIDLDPNMHYRWMNATPLRKQQLTVMDDYDIVDDEKPKLVGTDKAGQPLEAVLVAKPREYFEADQKAAAEARASGMSAIRKGNAGTGKNGDSGLNPDGRTGYVASEGISIKGGGYTP